jgi:threonine dehydrogenase-like Zn-dependent dehydrogenase
MSDLFTLAIKTNLMKKNIQQNGPNGAVYGLGMIGAAVYFISNAAGFGAGVVGVLKAIVWPAFLVYEAFAFFAG